VYLLINLFNLFIDLYIRYNLRLHIVRVPDRVQCASETRPVVHLKITPNKFVQ